MQKNIGYLLKKLKLKLWFKPLMVCLISVAAALLAQLADDSFITDLVPTIQQSSIEDLLKTMSSSMLVIAIFAVGSMLSAFAAASSIATPRSYKLIVSDSSSQNALSVFIGAFIFSIVSSIALKNRYYGESGHFTLFILTLIVFIIVILTFLKWVDSISKLGRMGHTIKKVEDASKAALLLRLQNMYMGGRPLTENSKIGAPVFATAIGYVGHINLQQLQSAAEENNLEIIVQCLPGAFISMDKPLAYIIPKQAGLIFNEEKIKNAFIIDDERSFYDDPRFGLIALSEIASRALSPAVNDPGTAIAILGSHERLFSLMAGVNKTPEATKIKYNRISVPQLSVADMFEDAFRPIARDGAQNIEVMLRLQKTLIAIESICEPDIKKIALEFSLQAFERAEAAIAYKPDVVLLKKHCLFNKS